MVEAAKFVRPAFRRLAADDGLVASIGLGFLAVCFLPVSTLPRSVNAQKWAFGVVGSIALMYLLSRVLAAYYPVYRGKRLFSHLGKDETMILQILLKQNKSAGRFTVLNTGVVSLLSKEILYYPSALIHPLDMTVALQPWALRHLREHPEVIGLKREEIGSDEIQNTTDKESFTFI
jgi:hypothetical protein